MRNARKIAQVWIGILAIVVIVSVAYASEVVDIEPSADAFVCKNHPDENYGTDMLLRARESMTQDACSYLKFFVRGPGAVVSAKLKMRVKDNAIDNVTLYSINDISWFETNITYNNRPGDGSAIETKTSLQSSTWYEFDVSSVVAKWGYVTFRIDTTQDADLLDWCSRESDYPPVLKVTFDSSAYSPPDLSNLDIFGAANKPQCGFFRQPDLIIKDAPDTGYAAWASMFSQLHGIVGKIANEITDYTYPTCMEYFTQFKLDYPKKIAIHHGAVNARDLDYMWQMENFEDCHWLHWEGKKVTADMSATDTIIYVEDAHYFSGPPFKEHNDVVSIHPLSNGKIVWDEWEYVEVTGVDVDKNKLIIKRGLYNTSARSFKANKTYAAPIVTVNHPGTSKFRLNLAESAPKDSEGKNGIDRFMENYTDWYVNGGIMERLDGIEFDVDMFSPEEVYTYTGWRHMDVDGDMKPDAGFINGVNDFALGRIEQTQQLRALVGTNRLLMGDIQSPGNQRLVWLYNGGESEGFPAGAGGGNKNGDQWSNGINRHRFWMANAVEPRLCYAGVRTIHNNFQEMRHRCAALAMIDSFPGMYIEPSDNKPFDEMVRGVDQQLNWLGAPMGSGRQLAVEHNNDVLNGVGVNLTTEFVNSWSSDNASIVKMGNELKFEGISNERTMTVAYESVALTDGSLIVAFDVRADSMPDYPSPMPRLIWVHADESSNLTVLPLKDAHFVFSMNGVPETAMDVLDLSNKKPQVLDISLDTYARVIWKEYNDEAGYYVNFPSFDPDDNPVVYWEKTVDLPAQEYELEYSLSVQENPWRGSSLGDVKFEVFVNGNRQKNTTISDGNWYWRTIDLSDWKGQTVTIRFQSSPGENYFGGSPVWGPAWLLPKGELRAYDRPDATAHLLMTFANDNPFDASFYFRDMGKGTFNISLHMEGDEPVYISNFRIFNTEDRWVREFEHGAVLVNPATHSKIFNLANLFPDRSFCRIQGSQNQDPETNDGSSVGETVSIAEKDGLFLMKTDRTRVK